MGRAPHGPWHPTAGQEKGLRAPLSDPGEGRRHRAAGPVGAEADMAPEHFWLHASKEMGTSRTFKHWGDRAKWFMAL